MTSERVVLPAPFGCVGIECEAGAVRRVLLLPADSALEEPSGPLARECARQLQRYFDEPRAPFELPLAPLGSAFQQRVWQQLAAIPVGEVRSYGDIARALGSAARAIGGACRLNPLPLIVPCHRVVPAGGGYGGFSGERAGQWPAVKRWLLTHEGVVLDS